MNTTAPKLRPEEKVYPNYNTSPTPEERKQDWLNALGPNARLKPNGKIEGCCPGCGREKECYVLAEGNDSNKHYQKGQCNNVDKCGYSESHKSRFPERYGNFIERFNKRNPDRQFHQLDKFEKTKAYLIERGLSEDTIDSLDQSLFSIETPSIDGVSLGECLMFKFANGQYLNGRAINPPQNAPSKHYTKGGAGASYFKPLNKYDITKTLYLAESPLKCISHIGWGNQAISICSAKPLTIDHPIFTDFKGFTIAVALDNDTNGAAQKVLRDIDKLLRSPEVEKLQIKAGKHIQPFIPGKGWDDLLKDGYKWADIQQKCEDSASLALAESAQDWVDRSVEIRNRNSKHYIPAVFEFRGKTYTWKFTTINNLKGPESSEFGEFTVKIVRFTRKETEDGEIADFNPVLEVINTAGSKPERFEIPIAGSEISTSDGLKKILQAKAKAVVLERTIPPSFIQHLYRKHNEVPVHTEWSKFGYHKKTGAFIFPDFAVREDGSYSFMKNGSVEIRPNEMYQPFKEGERLRISEKHQPTTGKAEKLLEFVEIAHAAYGNNSLIFIAWQAMGACRDAIQAEGIGTPFISAVGKPGTGKSKFLEWHQTLIGLDQEGITYHSSTPKARERILAQRSGLPISFKEVNNGKWDDSEWLHIIDGGNTGARAKYTNDIQIISHSIHCLPVFSGNFLPQMGMAMVSRMIPLEFTNERQAETEYDWNKLQDFITTPGNAEQSCLEFFREIQKIKKPDIWKPEFQKIKNELEQSAGSSAKKLDGYARVIQNYSLIYTFGKLIFENIGFKVEEHKVEEQLKSEVVVLMRRTFEKLGSPSESVLEFFDILKEVGCFEVDNYNRRFIGETPESNPRQDGINILKDNVRVTEEGAIYFRKQEVFRALKLMGYDNLISPKELKDHPARILKNNRDPQQRLKSTTVDKSNPPKVMGFNLDALQGSEKLQES